MNDQVDVVVAGHICLDLIPTLHEEHANLGNLLQPGRLVQVGPASISLGGCVANTGLALHRLGANVRLIGTIGDDLLGRMVTDSLLRHGENLHDSMIVAPDQATSYTVVINPPGVDRSFLHCSAANDAFSARDLLQSDRFEASILHFGYPPLMKEVVADGGVALARVFRQAQSQGALTSLDMAMPDIGGPRSEVNWKDWLENVLPTVDIFMPSIDEILLMLDPDTFRRLDVAAGGKNIAAGIDIALLKRLANELCNMGSPVVLFKLGDEGLYLQTKQMTSQILEDRTNWKSFDWTLWDDLQMLCPCFDVEVTGTTGAGDCTIAGLLMALLSGFHPKHALRAATTVGAYCVQSANATSGVPSWATVEEMVQSCHKQKSPNVKLTGWSHCEETGVFEIAI